MYIAIHSFILDGGKSTYKIQTKMGWKKKDGKKDFSRRWEKKLQKNEVKDVYSISKVL